MASLGLEDALEPHPPVNPIVEQQEVAPIMTSASQFLGGPTERVRHVATDAKENKRGLPDPSRMLNDDITSLKASYCSLGQATFFPH